MKRTDVTDWPVVDQGAIDKMTEAEAKRKLAQALQDNFNMRRALGEIGESLANVAVSGGTLSAKRANELLGWASLGSKWE